MKKIFSMIALLLMTAAGAMAQTYNVTVKDGTEDAASWTIDPATAEEGQTVTITYNGTKKVKSVKAVKKAKQVTTASTLSELKTAINNGTDCTSYVGWQVNSDGDIAESNVSGTLIGYVGYVSTSDVDTGVSGSRILVLASADASTGAAWGSPGISRSLTTDGMTGYSYTNKLQGYGSDAHPAAYAAWNYSATIPSGGATPAHWFLPSKKQWESMRDAQSGSSNQEKRNAMNSVFGLSGGYWSSTEDSTEGGSNGASYLSSNGRMYYTYKVNTSNVRACFAY